MSTHKLGVLKINGVEADLEFGDYDVNITDDLIYLGTSSVPANYVDHSSIEEWDELALHTGRDYKFIRNEIKWIMLGIVGPTFSGWDNLTDNEKKVVAKYVCCPIEKVIEQYGADTQLILDDYDLNSMKSREKRYQSARMYIFENMELNDAKQILVEATPLVTLYIGGIEGTAEDNVDGIFDWVLSRTQSSYYNNGLSTSSYSPKNPANTMEDIANGVMNILELGNY